jgi:signal transduction histidine kinase
MTLAAGGGSMAAGADGPAAVPWWFALASLGVIVLAAALGVLYGSLRGQQARLRQRQAAERDHEGLLRLFDGCWWQTDALHRLTRMQAPADADTGLLAAQAGQPLWQSLDTADAAGLRNRLELQGAVAGHRVVGPGDEAWVLSAQPRFDENGRFAGHHGTARRVRHPSADGLRADAAAQLLFDHPGPLLLATADADGPWRLARANAEAVSLLFGSNPATDPAWPGVAARLPVAVQQAVAAPAPGPQDVDGWRIRLAGSADGRQRVLLLTRPGADAGPGPGDERGEAESFGYTLSHDLRAPIRVVEGFTRIVKEDYGRVLDRVGNDHLDRVLSATARMNQMIDALLSLARLSSLPLARQPVNLSQLAGFVVDDLRRSAPERLADVDVQPGLLVSGDPTLLRLVLENLLGNAWKYSAKVPRARITLGTEAQGGRRVFVVRDNGAGFDMRSADRLFCLFQRLHSASDFAGTGVGLASVQRIVRRHGGQVWAEGEPGRGAAFYFTLRD